MHLMNPFPTDTSSGFLTSCDDALFFAHFTDDKSKTNLFSEFPNNTNQEVNILYFKYTVFYFIHAALGGSLRDIPLRYFGGPLKELRQESRTR